MLLPEYPEWEMLPHKLSKDEAENPYQVLDELFDHAHLPEIRILLWDWLKATVSGNYPALDLRERTSMLALYDMMLKTIEAAHILHVRHKAGHN